MTTPPVERIPGIGVGLTDQQYAEIKAKALSAPLPSEAQLRELRRLFSKPRAEKAS